ncbi:DNA mismatch repair protein MutS [Marinitoga hydrogenitolerans DSM 16785]|uniref:DNA mismatch repair protein MutS n=1 Tax=Marinitoga hydrogenitolerans (strain DSM 16785 / JCM 12826 / AT1271) TaxID=1122195 RepID=A0A1M4XRN0_MARH1|nr:DNA mismatch repair protein MutS [Marinitoga hydrogenitolerans]SHE96149.1 DNA mismatch repair protein MutS [Marinitoga hydrogenitolerans DSM 16785]
MTPMIRQYLEIKNQYQDCILLFRLGDFYETFFEDAKITSEALQITLTHRNGHPMAGIPHHALDNYLKKLLEQGFKVAICDQVEDPTTAKGIVKREVTKILTPGTVVEENMIDENNRYSLLIYSYDNEHFIFVIFDFSTGEIYIDSFEFSENEIIDFISSFSFVQILLSKNLKTLKSKIKNIYPSLYIEDLDEWYFNKNFEDVIKESYEILDIDVLKLNKNELLALGAVFKYLEITQKQKINHFSFPKRFKSSNNMMLDSTTILNLGLLPNQENKGKTLYDILKFTKTSMGSRTLQHWISKPLIKKENIEKRLNIIETFRNDVLIMEELKEYLSSVRDIERISSRISLFRATPRDLTALRISLEVLPYINELLNLIGLNTLEEFNDLKQLLSNAILEEPTTQVGTGKVIKKGFNLELDRYKKIFENSSEILKEIELKEKQKTGISNLKVARNKIYGFYIEVTKTNINKVPPNYIRKQTLVNSERFITEELRNLEEQYSIAEKKIEELEKKIYNDLIVELQNYVKDLKILSSKIAEIDILRGFAEASIKNNYIKPQFNNENLVIINGRHPVVEQFTDNFIPNNIKLDRKKRFVILTGPNMSGKSTYLRQIGIISIMAQIGSYVPAEYVELPILKNIFTRIGAKDDVVSGKSTFLVEMAEVSTILNNADENSLILLDEVGRGTGTIDGISVAWATSEYIYQVLKSYTIFATHYMELTMLNDFYDGIINKRVKVLETESGIIFLHKIEDGISDKSYGIEVAKLAGIPNEVVLRAKEVMNEISNKTAFEEKLKSMKKIKQKKFSKNKNQLKLF